MLQDEMPALVDQPGHRGNRLNEAQQYRPIPPSNHGRVDPARPSSNWTARRSARGRDSSATFSSMATWTASDGTEIAFEMTGSGPPLVLVHGITESRRNFDPLVPAIEAHHTVLSVDLRGHGESQRRAPYDLATFASDVHEVVGQVGIGDDALLVGHSLGGLVVTSYAAHYPCRGVLNIDQPLELTGLQEGLLQLAQMLRGDEATFRASIAMVFAGLRGPLEGAELARVEALHRPDQDVVLGVWDVLLNCTPEQLDDVVRSIASAVHVPYLSLHGIDPGPDYAAWLQERIPTAIVEVWPDHGHYPHLINQRRFLERLDTFAATLGEDR